jgi:hypothetical protein
VRPADADRDYPAVGEINPPHLHLDAEHARHERQGQVVPDQGGEGGQLLIIAVRIHDGLFNQIVQLRPTQLCHARQA